MSWSVASESPVVPAASCATDPWNIGDDVDSNDPGAALGPNEDTLWQAVVDSIDMGEGVAEHMDLVEPRSRPRSRSPPPRVTNEPSYIRQQRSEQLEEGGRSTPEASPERADAQLRPPTVWHPLSDPAPVPGTEWWATPLWQIASSFAARFPAQPPRAVKAEAFCAGMLSEAWVYKARQGQIGNTSLLLHRSCFRSCLDFSSVPTTSASALSWHPFLIACLFGFCLLEAYLGFPSRCTAAAVVAFLVHLYVFLPFAGGRA